MRVSGLKLLSFVLSLAICQLVAAVRSEAAQRRGAARQGRALMRSPSRRPAQRAIRRVAPRRPAIPWLRGNLPNVQAQGAFVVRWALR